MKKTERIRSGSGVGDNIYLYSIVKYFVNKGHKLEVCTKWPLVFSAIRDKIKLAPFAKTNIDYTAHYSNRKGKLQTDQFEDMCVNAGITEPVELKLDWHIRNRALTDSILEKAAGRKIVYVQSPRAPMGRVDNFGFELKPDFSRLDEILSHRGDYFAVMRGSRASHYPLQNIDHTVITNGNPSEVLDVGYISDLFVGQVGQIIPMAESFGKRNLTLWSRKGLDSKQLFIKQITPEKILHYKKLSWHAVDDWPPEKIKEISKRFFT